MIAHYILAGFALASIFILFLIISRTLNSIVNLLVKLEYMIRKEFDLKKELVEVRRIMEEQQSSKNQDSQSAAANAPKK